MHITIQVWYKNVIIISKEKLHVEFKKCGEDIITILYDAKILYNNKRYNSSICQFYLCKKYQNYILSQGTQMKIKIYWRKSEMNYLKRFVYDNKFLKIFTDGITELYNLVESIYQNRVENEKRLENA